MPPRLPLPRLTLYTGGKECSLCEVAKQELAKIRDIRPFQLELFNIRSPPADADAREAKRWRRLYQYDIPVLHLDGNRIQKHRINAPALIAALDRWQAQSQAQDDAEPRQVNGYSTESPPWRRKMGQVWFCLDSEQGLKWGEGIPEEEEDGFEALVESMFRNYAEEEWAVPILTNTGTDLSVEVDIDPERGAVLGDSSVIFNREEGSFTATKPSRPSQLCWNCREPGHILAGCPKARDHLQIRASRDLFNAQKDAMPEFAISYLESYRFTAEERDRRLLLLDRFKAGRVSDDLANAVFWIEDEEESLVDVRADVQEESPEMRGMRIAMLRVQRKRREWPWFEWMLKWGYAPGWVAGKDPIEEVRSRLKAKIIEEDDMETDSDDDLQVFGERDQVNPLPQSRSSRRLKEASDEGSEDMVMSDPSPSPPVSPPPPPPPDEPPPPPRRSPPRQPRGMPPTQPRSHINYPLPRRWVDYRTPLFDSQRLIMFTETRPLPIGYR